MRTILTLAFWASSLLATLPARAHEYHELDPLDPALRGFLINVLEDARDDGVFRGDFDNQDSVSGELKALLKGYTPEDFNWLKAKSYPEFEHPVAGRLPEGMIMQFFHDLAQFSHEYEDHGAAGFMDDATAAQHFNRLRVLSKDWWGTK